MAQAGNVTGDEVSVQSNDMVSEVAKDSLDVRKSQFVSENYLVKVDTSGGELDSGGTWHSVDGASG